MGASAEALYAELEQKYAAGDAAACAELVTSVKLALLDVAPADAGARVVGLKTLEYAVLLAVRQNDAAGFQRNMAQLKAYYASPVLAAKTDKRRMILGLHLLFLVVENRLAEFHSEMELLNDADRTCGEVEFASGLERALVVGTYDAVLAARTSMPAPEHYAPLMARLTDTVRETIADCAAAAYDSLGAAALREMLMLQSDADLDAFVAAYHPEWMLKDGRMTFGEAPQPKAQQIPATRLIEENCTYATELDRIV